MSTFVLDLGKENGLATERRGARDPVSLGQHADDLAVRMLADLPHQRLAVGFRHPVLGFDELVGCHPRFEGLDQLGVLGRFDWLDVP